MNNQAGFAMPLVLFAVATILTIIFSHIYIYTNDIHITKNHREQIKMETLFQMSLVRLKEDLHTIENYPAYLSYEFPYGNVTVRIPDKNNDELTFHIYTDDHGESTIYYHL